jgi:hypothetical protein
MTGHNGEEFMASLSEEDRQRIAQKGGLDGVRLPVSELAFHILNGGTFAEWLKGRER